MDKNKIGKILYGTLFIIIFPAYLIILSNRLYINMPVINGGGLGLVVIIIGLLIMCMGMLDIIIRGRGLPMNAYPPNHLVTEGIYKILPHPIYFGFCLAVVGYFLYNKSAGGIYLISPAVILGTFALVEGYENHFLYNKFGKFPRPYIDPVRIMKFMSNKTSLDKVWHNMLNWSEKKANSWKCWHFGRIRVINHFLYSGLAGGLGALIILLILGKNSIINVLILMLMGIIGAMIIGQILVGSRGSLNRPFGYFGGLFAIGIIGIMMYLLKVIDLDVLAAFSMAAPWVQAIGRVRCLIQGCCHGDTSRPQKGIVVTNIHSRVCNMSNKCGIPIYATQLYSIIGNVILGIWLLFLWSRGVMFTSIIGIYLIGAGSIRFIEESFRGEPLTRVIKGLRIYQWFSILIYVCGFLIMSVKSGYTYRWRLIDIKLGIFIFILFFVICAFAMSVDFPYSKKRFSKLSG